MEYLPFSTEPILVTPKPKFPWILLLTLWGLCTAHAAQPSLVITPDNPLIDNTGEGGIATVQIDLTPETKATLNGQGQIPVELSVAPWTCQLLGPDRVSISYRQRTTTPVTVRFRKAPWMPNPANEFEDKLCWIAASTGSNRVTAQATSRGSFYPTVKDSMTRNRPQHYWIGPHLDQDGRYLYDLVRYFVPESAFDKWAPFVTEPTTIAAGHQLGYEPEELTAAGTGSIGTPYGLYTIEAFGWPSQAAIFALEQSYIQQVRPKNDNFSFSLRNRVPVSYFLTNLAKLPTQLDSGVKDYRIAALYHKEKATERFQALGYSASTLMTAFENDYRLVDYVSIPPHAAGAMAQTYSQPTWRQDAPIALVVFNREDLVEGTFGEAEIIGHLSLTHRIVIGQAPDADRFLAIARKAHQRHGAFDLVVLAGHGNPVAAACLSIHDQPAFTELHGMLKPDATVLLASCSGASFAADAIDSRIRVGQTAAVHIAAAMQEVMPNVRVAAATDLISKALVRYDADAATPAQRYRVFFEGAGVFGDVSGRTPLGVPCDWLRREFGPTHDWTALEQEDADGDCQPNWLEHWAGTNPRSSQDRFAVGQFGVEGNRPVLKWSGSFRNEHGTPYRILGSFNLAAGEWQELASGINRSVKHENVWQGTLTTAHRAFYSVGM